MTETAARTANGAGVRWGRCRYDLVGILASGPGWTGLHSRCGYGHLAHQGCVVSRTRAPPKAAAGAGPPQGHCAARRAADGIVPGSRLFLLIGIGASALDYIHVLFD